MVWNIVPKSSSFAFVIPPWAHRGTLLIGGSILAIRELVLALAVALHGSYKYLITNNPYGKTGVNSAMFSKQRTIS